MKEREPELFSVCLLLKKKKERHEMMGPTY